MKHLIFFVAINFAIVFFIITSILGVNYLGAGESSLYTMSCVGVNLLAILAFMHGFVFKKIKIMSEILIMALFQFLLFLIYQVESPDNEYAANSIFIIYAFSAPACYIAYYVAKTKSFCKMIKWLDIFMILLTIGVAINLPTILSYKAFGDVETTTEVININYQSAAYYLGVAYSINLLFLLNGSVVNNVRFKFTQYKIYETVSVVLLALQVVMCLMTGGRGGFVLIVVSTLVMIMLFGTNGLKKIVGPFMLINLIGLVAVFIMKPDIIHNIGDVLADSTSRTFAYITDGGINLKEGSSGRDEIYTKALSNIQERPFFGYGMFKYMDTSLLSYYPHNFFLEILLQGGFVYLMLVASFLTYLFLKLRIMLQRSTETVFLLPFVLYVSTILMFSGSYMTTSLFWFILMYIYCYNLNNNIK